MYFIWTLGVKPVRGNCKREPNNNTGFLKRGKKLLCPVWNLFSELGKFGDVASDFSLGDFA